MARMIPSFCPNSAPPGEKALYAELSQSVETDGWIVLHSLSIADHVRQVEGEADFVVIIPNQGVLFIEVKSHLNIERHRDGTWKLGNDAPTLRSPFRQASEAMYSLRKYLEQAKIDLRSVPMIAAVWFTGVRARNLLPANPEWHSWQVLDSDDLKLASAAVVRTLKAGTRHLVDKVPGFSDKDLGPDSLTTEALLKRLRPRFELATAAGDRRRNRESDLIRYMQEQFLALDAVSDNQAILFTGPAGSGKTFLAQETARRELADGKVGRLLCFNRLLSRHLHNEMRMPDGLKVNTFHGELLSLAGITNVPSDATSNFWDIELPEKAIEALLVKEPDYLIDFLIVDEIQDIATPLNLDILDLMVRGGLRNGRLVLFGDFEKQAIYKNSEGKELLQRRIPALSTYKLLHNCRNVPRIGYQVNLLSNFHPGYELFRRIDDGVDPTIWKYTRNQDQSSLLRSAINNLRNDGYALNEIVVLSSKRTESVAETSEDAWLRQILTKVDEHAARAGQVRYSTIHAFKGLEAPAVILTDMDAKNSRNFESLLYVGLTRATDRLYAFVETDTLRSILGGAR